MTRRTKDRQPCAITGERAWSEERMATLRTCVALAVVLAVPMAWLAPDLLGINHQKFTVSATYAGAPTEAASPASSR